MSLAHEIKTSSDHKAWIEKIQSELKGKELSSYDYVWDGIHISPFDPPSPVRRVISKKENNEWYQGCQVKSSKEHLNKFILSVLQLGARALLINVDSTLNWEKVFKGVHLDWIQSEFELNDLNAWEDLSSFLLTYPLGKIGGVCWVDENKQVDFFTKYQQGLPGFRFLTIQVNTSDSGQTIAVAFKKLLDRISVLSANFESKEILNRIGIKFVGGEDLVLNICMLRALRLLWMQALNSAGLDVYTYEIFLSARVPFIKSVAADQMIASSLIATSLVLGGVDTLCIADPDEKNPDPRWGLMAQHILWEEARLHVLNDPLSGSHVIERLTGVIAKKVWESVADLK